VKSKLKFILPLVAVIGLGVYKFALAKPAPAPKPKIHGQVYVLPKDFLINLAGGRFAKLDVGLVLAPTQKLGDAAGHAAVKPPEGFGPLEQEAVVRDIVTDTLTGAPASSLVGEAGRRRLKQQLLADIRKHTDVEAEDVLFTDVAVQ
jgi:flagellar FliL protein